MRARREAMQARISSLRAVIADVPPRLSAGIACRDENPARIPALQARRAAFSIENAEMRAPISSFRARREAVPAPCAAKSRCKEALRARISSLRARIAALHARIAEIPSSIAALRPRRADVRSRADAPTLRCAARRLRFAAVPAGRGAMHAKEDSLPSGKASRAALFADPRACLARPFVRGGPGPTTRPFPLNPKAGRALNVFLASSERSVQSWTMSVGPRRFDENSAKVTVAGLGDRAPSRCASARVLARHRPAVAHQLRGSLETRDLAHFGDQSRGGQFRDSAQRLQPLRALRMSLRTAIAHLPAAVSVWL
jgi:hypothetical protein